MFCRSIADHLVRSARRTAPNVSVIEALPKSPNLKHVLHLSSLYLAEMIEDHLEKILLLI